jgi:putative exporter of polyketide antibiotics
MSYTPPPPPPAGDMAGGYAAPKTNSKAIWSLVLGILGLVCCGFFTGIPALILGNMAKKEIDTSGGAQSGRGMAQAGFILGIIAIVFGLIGVVLYATGALTFSGSTSTG